jgi:hypothetical protein
LGKYIKPKEKFYKDLANDCGGKLSIREIVKHYIKPGVFFTISHMMEVLNYIVDFDNPSTLDRETFYGSKKFYNTMMGKIESMEVNVNNTSPELIKKWNDFKPKIKPKLIFIQVKRELLSKHKYVELRSKTNEVFNPDISRSILMMLGVSDNDLCF